MNTAPRTPTVLQHEVCECGLAALAMLMGYHGCHVPLHQLRVISGVSRDGTSMLRLRDLARHFGFDARAVSREPERLAELGFPVMAFVNFNHMVVIEELGPNWVRVNDPAGGPKRIEREQFDRMFTGIALCISPGPNFARRPAQREFARLLRPAANCWPWLLGLLLAEASFQFLACEYLLVPHWLAAVGALAGLVVSALMADRLAASVAHHLHRPISETLFSRCASYIGYRSLPFLGAQADSGGLLGRELGAAAALIARIGMALVPLSILLSSAPAAAGGVCAAILVCLGMIALALGRRGSSWAGALRGGGGRSRYAMPLEAVLESPSLLLGGRDDDVLSALLGARAESSAVTSRVAFAEGVLGAATVAVLAVAVSMTTGTASMGLAALAAWPWLALPALPSKLISIRRICSVIADLDAAPQAKHVEPLAAPDGVLEASGLAFGYGTAAPPLFRGVSVRAEAGSQIAITGPAGTGKSTLAQLLASYMEPWEGSVASGGRVILVPARPVLFQGSMLENVTLWEQAITPERAREALDLVGLWREVGNRTVEAGGRNLSGGQRRRVEIARALVRDPAVLVVDEALDGLDLDGDRRIRAALRERGITLVLVTQRAETLAECDDVLTLGKGASAPSCAPTAPAAENMPEPEGAQPQLAPDQAAALEMAARYYRIRGSTEARAPFGVDPIRWSARLMGLHLRRVRLRGQAWYRRGSEPLIANAPGSGWQALLPRMWGGYRASQDLEEEAFAVQPRPPGGENAGSYLRRLIFQALWPESWGLAAGVLLWSSAFWLTVSGPSGLAAIGMLAGGAGFSLARARATARLAIRGELGLTAHLLRLPFGLLARHGSATAARWTESCNQVLGRGVGDAFSMAVHAVAVAGLLTLLPQRADLLAAGCALTVVALAPVALRLMGADGRAVASDIAWRMLAGLLGLPARERTQELRARWRKLSGLAQSRQRAPQWAESLGDAAATAIILGWAGHLLQTSPADAPLGVIALLAMRQLAGASAGLVGALAAGGRLVTMIHAPVEDGGQKPLSHDGGLHMSNVSFAYPAGKTLFHGLSLSVEKGEVIAVLGPSGGGKSTLLALAIGLLSPQKGSVQFGGWDTAQVDRTLLRHWCDGVLQDEVLPLATVRNYLLANSIHDAREAWQALAVVGLAETVARWPMGIHSIIEDRTVSAGQAQQLRLARALIRCPRLLVLDEATGALDPACQDMIFAEIRRRGITTLFAAHRADSAALADRVYLLDAGRLVAQPQPNRRPTGAGGRVRFTPAPPLSIYRPSALKRFEGPEILDRIAELPTIGP